MNKYSVRKVLTGLLAVMALTLIISQSAFAVTKGWNKIGGKLYYYTNTSGELTKLTGLQKIGNRYFYFNASGAMQKGWVATPEGYRFFRKTGKKGTIGSMYTGFKAIGKKYYYFDANGIVQTGFRKLSKHTYFFSTSNVLGTRGKALTKAWAVYNGNRYYFNNKGYMLTSRWISGAYYVGPDGRMMKNAVTPDGKIVGADGKKIAKNGWVSLNGNYYFYSKKLGKIRKSQFINVSGKKYYVNSSGVRQTGWQTIGGAKYYFNDGSVMQKGKTLIGGKYYYFGSDGKLVINKTVNGYTTDAEGVIKADPEYVYVRKNAKPRILIVAGHGQGDIGATSLGNSKGTQEAVKTREFASLIYNQLKADSRVDVDYYMNGSMSFNLFTQHGKTFSVAAPGSTQTFITLMTGKGEYYKKNAAKIQAQYAKNSNLPKIYEYDFVLEVHFNAKASKETKKNNSFFGVGVYINKYKKSAARALDRKIVAQLAKGYNGQAFKVWGEPTGVFESDGLRNARMCAEQGVDYTLLETCFIDDMDDMAFYEKNKNNMAKTVADSIASFYAG